MARLGSWIEAHATGIHVPAGDFCIDPALSTERALITHGLSDHARGGPGHVLATPETLAIMPARYGEAGHAQAISYGEKVDRNSNRLNHVTNAHLVFRLLLVSKILIQNLLTI